MTLQAFDLSGELIASDVKIDTGGPLLTVTTPNIHRVRFFSSTANVAFDDFTFEAVTHIGDVNGDGMVGVSDLLAVIAAWGPCADLNDCPADVTYDGLVNVSDLLLVIASWG